MRDAAAHRRVAFTLFEVAVALALVAVGVVSVALLLPAGIKAQQLARFRLYAAAKAVDLVESYCTSSNGNPSIDVEAPNPWDVPTNDRSTASDLECRLASRRFGIAPLPTAIARRLDSDNDAIARILDDGGCVYYSQPQATTTWEESQLPKVPPNDSQKLVFAVVGEAQQDALFVFPWKAWPYTTSYPSPPIFEHHWDAFMDAGGAATPDCGPTFGCYTRDFRCYLWEETSDPDIRNVFQHPFPPSPTLAENYGYFPYAYPRAPEYALPAAGAPEGACPAGLSADGAVRYVQAALWYCAAKGLDASFWDIAAPLTDFVGAPADDQRWKQVDAMRFLAHAGACLTRWYDKGALDVGVAVPSVTWDTLASPIGPVTSSPLTVTHAHLLAWHESALALEWRYAAADPYDWGAPRSVMRAMMMDWPLLQHDLFSPPLSGPIAGAPALTGSQWRPVAPRPITNLGAGCSYPKVPITDAIWGERSHFNLCAPFAPAERCRELVFWVVDWQAYEDFETCASAAVDASRYAKAGPLTDGSGGQRDFASLMTSFPWIDTHIYSYRNAESVFSFTRDVHDEPAGLGIAADRVLNNVPDQGTSAQARSIFNGLWGGDRNFNGVLDHGPVPTSARMRAVEVARYPYYDLRVPFALR